MSLEDGELLGGAIEEQPEKPEHLQQALEGKQLAWLYLPGLTPDWRQLIDVGCPERWDALALEFTDGSKMTIMAAPVDPPGSMGAFRTVVLWRWFERATWATRKQQQHWRGYTDQPLVSPIQQWVHGLILRGATVEPTPNQQGGQNVLLEFSEGTALHLRTRRRAQQLDPNTGEWAAFELGMRRGKTIISPGDLGIARNPGGIILP